MRFIKETNLLEAGIETVNLSVMQCLQEILSNIFWNRHIIFKRIFRFEITESLATEDKMILHILHSLTKRRSACFRRLWNGFSNTASLMSYPFFEINDKSLIVFIAK